VNHDETVAKIKDRLVSLICRKYSEKSVNALVLEAGVTKKKVTYVVEEAQKNLRQKIA
jgi:hypothetical protein